MSQTPTEAIEDTPTDRQLLPSICLINMVEAARGKKTRRKSHLVRACAMLAPATFETTESKYSRGETNSFR